MTTVGYIHNSWEKFIGSGRALSAGSVAIFTACISMLSSAAFAQIRHKPDGHRGSLYFTVGYNKPTYSKSTVHIEQKTLGNSYDLLKVKADNQNKTGSLDPLALNIRIGYYFDYFQLWGVELSYDPLNYHIADMQTLQMKGTVNNVAGVDAKQVFSEKAGNYYYMGGANMIGLNLVRRYDLWPRVRKSVGVDAIGRIGGGPLMPSLETSFNGKTFKDPQFQMRGWNFGIETALRFTIKHHLYLELSQKYNYAMYSDMKIFSGTAKQNIGAYQLIGSLGYTIKTTKRNAVLFGLSKN